MGFNLCVPYPDFWRRPAVKPKGTEYYEYIMTYVDNIITVFMDAVGILEVNTQITRLNNDNICPSSDYLGAVIVKKKVDSINFWITSCQKYVKYVLENLAKGQKSNPYHMPSKVLTPTEKKISTRNGYF